MKKIIAMYPCALRDHGRFWREVGEVGWAQAFTPNRLGIFGSVGCGYLAFSRYPTSQSIQQCMYNRKG
jgi:hypothetical protein